MNSKNLARIWLGAGISLMLILAVVLAKSPFLYSSGPLAEFEHSRAFSAGIIGIAGTLILTLGGWLLLKYRK